MQTTLKHAELEAVEAASEQLAAMPTRDLIEHAISTTTTSCDAITVALIDRLESYMEELDRMETHCAPLA